MIDVEHGEDDGERREASLHAADRQHATRANEVRQGTSVSHRDLLGFSVRAEVNLREHVEHFIRLGEERRERGDGGVRISSMHGMHIVSAWHVLEHVEDIDSFLKKCSEITNKYCIIEIPLLRSLSGTGRVRKLVDPQDGVYDGHAHYFTKQSFVNIADKYFDIVEIREGVQSPALFAVMEPKI